MFVCFRSFYELLNVYVQIRDVYIIYVSSCDVIMYTDSFIHVRIQNALVMKIVLILIELSI